MIIWLNGPFGVGKTQTAIELQRRLANSFICDPEEIGFALRSTVPFTDFIDFQDVSLWREFTRRTLEYLYLTHAGTIIVPMTLVVDQYFDEIVGNLRRQAISVRHFTLLADKANLLERLQRRGEENDSWPARQIDRCLEALQSTLYAEHIGTDGRTIGQVADKIMEHAFPYSAQ